MTSYIYTYKTLVAKAKEIKNKAEKEYSKPSGTWAYYLAKAILNLKKDIKKIEIKPASKSTGDNFGRQIKKADYLDMAKRLVKYVDSNKQIPNYITISGKKMKGSDFTLMFANILVYYDKNNALPSQVNVNSKIYTKPSEPANEVLAYFQKKTGIKLTCIDDFCDWCKNKVDYEFYFDDQKSNKQVIDSRAGNCTDLTQVACNIAEGLDYEWKAIHVKCNQSGTGHIYPMFRKSGVNGGKWFIRDVACISDESRYCTWCEAGNGGTQIAVNPAWFLENLRR